MSGSRPNQIYQPVHTTDTNITTLQPSVNVITTEGQPANGHSIDSIPALCGHHIDSTRTVAVSKSGHTCVVMRRCQKGGREAAGRLLTYLCAGSGRRAILQKRMEFSIIECLILNLKDD